MTVNNEFYATRGGEWWREDAGFEFASLRYCVNPVRYGYFARKLWERNVSGGSVLDIGCGGGFLAEEFAKDGYAVTGIDPAAASVAAAMQHAAESGLAVDYLIGRGESLPFAAESFDIVTCCDVLEHVDDPERVIGEAARTLKPGGLFLFDTINRTGPSKLVMIKIWQDWRLTRLCPVNSHVWEKSLTPDELLALFAKHGLAGAEMRGIGSRRPLAMLWNLPAIRAGRLSGRALADVLALREEDEMNVSYMGVAIKRPT